MGAETGLPALPADQGGEQTINVNLPLRWLPKEWHGKRVQVGTGSDKAAEVQAKKLPATGPISSPQTSSSHQIRIQAKDGQVVVSKVDLFAFLGKNVPQKQLKEKDRALLAKALQKRIKEGISQEEKLKVVEDHLAHERFSSTATFSTPPADRAFRISQAESKLPFTLFSTPHGVYAHLKEPLGKGEERTVFGLIHVDPNEVFDRAKTPQRLALGKVKITDPYKEINVRRELRLLHELEECPEIIKLHFADIYSSSTTGQLTYALFYEYCDEGSLIDFEIKLWGQSVPSEERDNRSKTAWNILIDILQGLAKLEEKGIHHRDIKADNILLYKDKDGEIHAKIADFGLADTLEHELQEPEPCGTPQALAPEVAKGSAMLTEAEKMQYKAQEMLLIDLREVEEKIQRIEKILSGKKIAYLPAGEEEALRKEAKELRIEAQKLQQRSEKLMEEAKVKKEEAAKLLASIKSDIWGAGLVLYSMRTHRRYPEAFDSLMAECKRAEQKDGPNAARRLFLSRLPTLQDSEFDRDVAGEFATLSDTSTSADSLAKLNRDMLMVDPAKRPAASELLQRALRLRGSST